MLLVLSAFAIFILFLIVSGGYIFVVACCRRKELPWLVKEKMEKTPYKEFYPFITEANRWLHAHEVQDVFVKSHDGLRLHGLWIPAKHAKGTILFAHGYRSTYLIDFALALDFYHNHGMNLLIPDQRAHGKSEGHYITFGVKESRDMLTWLNFHNEQQGSIPVVLSGLSMGASTMMYLADEMLPSNVKGIIADCGFTSPKEILKKVFTQTVHLPAGPSLFVVDIFARMFAGFSLNQKDSRTTLQKNKLPIILIHGMQDDFVPCDMTRQAYQVCTGPKQLLLVPDAGHGLSFLKETEQYVAMIEEFLQKNVFQQCK